MQTILEGLGCPALSTRMALLSAAEHRVVSLCRLLALQPDLLLLEEPSSELDSGAAAWLTDRLQNYPGSVVVVANDDDPVHSVASYRVGLHKGQIASVEQR